jgi:hypothetical protein
MSKKKKEASIEDILSALLREKPEKSEIPDELIQNVLVAEFENQNDPLNAKKQVEKIINEFVERMD